MALVFQGRAVYLDALLKYSSVTSQTKGISLLKQLETFLLFALRVDGQIFSDHKMALLSNLCSCFFPQDQDGQIHQVWYDDPQSICPKADLVMSKGMRGIGMWNANILDYSDDPVARQQTTMMWNALLGC